MVFFRADCLKEDDTKKVCCLRGRCILVSLADDTEFYLFESSSEICFLFYEKFKICFADLE